jgi:anti-anti-sigma regulatory factor
MSGGNTKSDSLHFGEDERGLFLAARGSIRAVLCFPLREALLDRLDARPVPPAVYADLSQCQYMDSTFVGLLVAVDKKLQKASGSRLRLARPSSACRTILEDLGLKELLLVEEGCVEPPQRMKEISSEVPPGPELILRAHEALMETSENARKRFGLLRDLLEKKLRGGEPGKKPPAE